ncbi:uncharacterized protein K452DRAFT_234009 [Aplosporella prunicola CBS 121167]|uniref:Peptidase A1 domain-containing protein n=1 Tax=Aplosporella prunicola CBS 121167 TaxID=1176127 RepID=A0A6A6B5D7_9PEZI|nr:uncharacterized protein K452DRAFT_234009 [Aplosporella prunicola CBS 121167]KAF2138485.1 hypothetical protein K452DRAFT_234009 [Aplosporella prunicola CBS 121167]
MSGNTVLSSSFLTPTRVERVHNPSYQRSGLKSYVYAIRKYNIGPTMDGPYFCCNKVHQQGKHGVGRHIGGRALVQQHVLQKRVDAQNNAGEVTVEDQQNDSEYLCRVTVGTPGQTFLLDPDTGSADLWIPSNKLPFNARTHGHTYFDPSKSSTYKQTKSTWRIQYGDQSSASGIVGTDNVKIGGITIKNQAVELATQLSSQFVTGVTDGLLGLAWGNINTVQPHPVATPVENMITQDDIPKGSELFTAHLGSWRDKNEPDQGKSFYTFGYIDQDVLKASGVDPYYVPIDNSQGFWQFNSASATINGTTIQRSGNTAIADTGTTLALVDDDTVVAIYSAIPGSRYDSSNQGFIFPTNTLVNQLPDVTFAVGDKQFTVQKEDLAFANAGNGMVYGGIQSRGDLPFDILGDTFLKGIYAIFDMGNKRFGAVPRVETEQNLAAPQ